MKTTEVENCSLENSTVCYLCSILDEQTKAERAIMADSPAATKKVLDVSGALKSKVGRIYVLSMGRGKQVGEYEKHGAFVKRLTGVPVLYAAFSPVRFLTYANSSLSLVVLMLRIRKQGNVSSIHVIVYNRQWLYLPVLIVSRLFSMKCYLDLEDGPVFENVGLMKRLSYKLNRLFFDRLCSHGSILVNPALVGEVNTRNNIICYGVAENHADDELREWAGETIRFLFGGSLLRETGVLLLIDAVKILNSKYSDYKGRILIDITGYGELSDELAFLSKNEGLGWVVFHGRVSLKKYNLLLKRSHVGFCLKLPSTEMGVTTFPSKTIEIASYGKLLLTTDLEHVSTLFGTDGACYLSAEKGEDLAEIMVNIVDDPQLSMKTAEMGKERILRKCSAERVAEDICSLFKYAG